MSYKLGEQVQYKGGEVNFGELRELFPAKTYLWKNINYGDKQLYIIQHNNGEPAKFFEENKHAFGENIDFDDLIKMADEAIKGLIERGSKNPSPIKFAYVWESELEPIKKEAPKTPSPLPYGRINISQNIPKQEEKPKEEELMKLDEYLEESDSETPTENTTEAIKNLFTSENIEVNSLNTAAPKPQKYYFIKMNEEFHIQKPNTDVIEQGLPGEYLICTQSKKLSIVSEAEFNEKFQANKELIVKVIGKAQEEFLLNKTVANYIDFIEAKEIKAREELYLKTHPSIS